MTLLHKEEGQHSYAERPHSFHRCLPKLNEGTNPALHKPQCQAVRSPVRLGKARRCFPTTTSCRTASRPSSPAPTTPARTVRPGSSRTGPAEMFESARDALPRLLPSVPHEISPPGFLLEGEEPPPRPPNAHQLGNRASMASWRICPRRHLERLDIAPKKACMIPRRMVAVPFWVVENSGLAEGPGCPGPTRAAAEEVVGHRVPPAVHRVDPKRRRVSRSIAVIYWLHECFKKLRRRMSPLSQFWGDALGEMSSLSSMTDCWRQGEADYPLF